MVVTVTMNPAIDKTIEVDELNYGGLNRTENVILDAGGKGINVSKTIKYLGGETLATGFLGGNNGKIIQAILDGLSIRTDFIQSSGEVRTNIKIVDGKGIVTEINEAGVPVEQAAIDKLLLKLEGIADRNVIFVLSGSIPAGIDPGIYGTIIHKVKKKGARVFLDAEGEAFAEALKAKPHYVKPNRYELEQYFSFNRRAGISELISMGKKIQDLGIETVIISLGPEGSLYILPEAVMQIPGLQVKAHSTVGAGDAMVAAIAYGIDCGLLIEECIKLGAAASAAAVTTKGTKPPRRATVDEMLEKVKLIRVYSKNEEEFYNGPQKK